MYIHQHTCISPQHTALSIDLQKAEASVEGKMIAIEPPLEGVPPGMVRRMSKAVRMGMGAGLPILKNNKIDGIIIGTANGGMEDCIKFLNQIVDFDEGMLTPGNFVQSTPNALAGQLGLVTKNHGYNVTHVHLGLAFENALIDAGMMLKDEPGSSYIVGGVDEISVYNYHIDFLAGWYSRSLTNENLYIAGEPATIAGEGAAMFLVNNNADGATAKLGAIDIFQTTETEVVKSRFEAFIKKNVSDTSGCLFISGENGDTRLDPFYRICESVLKNECGVVRYKHVTGEYPTASSFALWLGCYALNNPKLPDHFYKYGKNFMAPKNLIIYNQYHGLQHSFMMLQKV